MSPRLLTLNQKRIRMAMSRTNLAIFEASTDGFYKRFVTQDESSVHHFEKETVNTVEAQDFSTMKEGKGGGPSRVDDGLNILGCKEHFNDRLALERLHYQQRLLRQFIETAAKRNQIKATWNANKRCSGLPGK